MARRAVARRAGSLVTKVDNEAGQAAEKRPAVRPKFSESLGGPSWTRTRSQWIKNAATRLKEAAFLSTFRHLDAV
jgi:hypothetical protein